MKQIPQVLAEKETDLSEKQLSESFICSQSTKEKASILGFTLEPTLNFCSRACTEQEDSKPPRDIPKPLVLHA